MINNLYTGNCSNCNCLIMIEVKKWLNKSKELPCPFCYCKEIEFSCTSKAYKYLKIETSTK